MNLNNIDNTRWNYTISLNEYIKNLSSSLESYFNTYFDNSIDNSLSNIELLLIKLGQITRISTSKIIIKLISNRKLEKKLCANNKYWSSGTGYGSGNSNSTWNIHHFLQKQKESNNDIIEILKNINKNMKVSDFDIKLIFTTNILSDYIINNFNGLTILELDNKKDIFSEILSIIKFEDFKSIPFNFTNKIYMSMKDFVEDLNNDIYSDETVLSALDENIRIICDEILTVSGIYRSQYEIHTKLTSQSIPVTKINTSKSNVKDIYFDIVNKNQFNYNKLFSTHRFFEYKSVSIKPKAIMRIVSEFNSLKKNLPNNWDSSILLRVPKSNLNLITFLIVGPKDTPYHNGLFEFHAYFPDDYPNSVPKVLLNTTGGGRVRFNPNLYNCGKVCLSLLGTWSGESGESWNPQISTFLQVLISIQSLIFVEKPYFNEPGYERTMKTPTGELRSFDYSDKIRLETINIAINNVIQSIDTTDTTDTTTYSNFIKEHFKLKYMEICETIEQWLEESTKQKAKMNIAYNNFKKVYAEKIDSNILV